MHFKASKHRSLLNHNRHFAAHSLFIASINMEKPCLNSPAIGSPLMLTVIMVILVPGITRCPHLSFTTPWNTHRWSYALVRWNRKWEKNSRQKSTMGAAFWGNKSFSAGIYRADNGPQGCATTKVGGQTQPPIHTRLLAGKTDFTYVPQICFAPNSSRKLLVTAATDFFLFKTSSLTMTQSRNLEGDMAEAVSRVWLNKTRCSLFTATTPTAEGQVSSRSQLQHISSLSTLIHLICLCQGEDAVHLLNRLGFGVCVSAWVEIITKEQDRLCAGHQRCRSRINKPQWQRLSTQLAPEPRDRGKVNKQWIFISRPVCVPLMCK